MVNAENVPYNGALYKNVKKCTEIGMKKIAYIVVYMGKFPNYFMLWLESCRYNESVDFIIFTDDYSEYGYPHNVHVNYMTFYELKVLVQKKLNFPIVLNEAYKLCDFKPAYGEIFSEYLAGYDFWGHCDIDLVWGNIRRFVTDELLESCVRIYPHGHCSLYKNTLETNSLYRTLKADGYRTYKDVFSDESSFAFDEWPGITSVMKINNIPMYINRDYADLVYDYAGFKFLGKDGSIYKGGYFKFNNGDLYWTDGKHKEVEFLYVHFQKRKLKINGGGVLLEKNFIFFRLG